MAGRNAYTDSTLVAVIGGTDTALDRMAQINAQVSSLAEQVPQVNRSVSGNRLGTAFVTWTTDYNKVVNDLRQLNDKAKALLQSNRSTDEAASGQAGRAF